MVWLFFDNLKINNWIGGQKDIDLAHGFGIVLVQTYGFMMAQNCKINKVLNSQTQYLRKGKFDKLPNVNHYQTKTITTNM